MTEQVSQIIYNSPALHSLKHQQLSSLCARYKLKSTGKKDVLIERLKTLRTTPEALEEHGRLPRSYAAEEEHSTAHESFAIIEHDDQVIEGESKSEAASAAAPAGSATTTATARVSESNASVRTDEFGALQLDAPTLVKSSSWKDKISKVFGGSASTTTSSSSSSNSLSSLADSTMTITAHHQQPSSSSNSLSSLADSTMTITAHHQQPSSSSGGVESSGLPTFPHSGKAGATPRSSKSSNESEAPAPGFKILEDSFAANNTTVWNDPSFVPRASFEGDSVALSSVPVWPPPPGVVIISPRQSPPRSMLAALSGVKRSNEEVGGDGDNDATDDDDDNGIGNDLPDSNNLDGYFQTIRLLPKLKGNEGLVDPSATPSRKIAKVPKRFSMIANSPPQFSGEAPPLPSLNVVCSEISPSPRVLLPTGSASSSQSKTVETGSDTSTAALPSSDLVRSPSLFVFGSPAQKQVTNTAFSQTASKVLEEMQRRIATEPVSSSSSLSAVGEDLIGVSDSHGRSELSKSSRPHGREVRFDGKHEKEFSRMDSIANHYAAKRATFTPSKRTKVEAPSINNTSRSGSVSSGLSALSRSSSLANNLKKAGWTDDDVTHRQHLTARSVSQSSTVSHASSNRQHVDTQAKGEKSGAQKAEDRRRIAEMSGLHTKSSGSVHHTSPRKAAQASRMASSRKLPPLSVKSQQDSTSSSGSTASRLFKSTVNTLKSLTSSSSVATSSGTPAPQRPVSAAQPDCKALHKSASSSYLGSSLMKPTAASLARSSSVLSIRSVSTSQGNLTSNHPGAVPSTIISGKPQGAPLHHSSSTMPSRTHPVAQPRPPKASMVSQTPSPKKRMSSVSSAQRQGAIGSHRRDRSEAILEARKLRLKKDLRQQRAIPAPAAAEMGGQPDGSSSASAMTPSISKGSLAGRPAWR